MPTGLQRDCQIVHVNWSLTLKRECQIVLNVIWSTPLLGERQIVHANSSLNKLERVSFGPRRQIVLENSQESVIWSPTPNGPSKTIKTAPFGPWRQMYLENSQSYVIWSLMPNGPWKLPKLLHLVPNAKWSLETLKRALFGPRRQMVLENS